MDNDNSLIHTDTWAIFSAVFDHHTYGLKSQDGCLLFILSVQINLLFTV